MTRPTVAVASLRRPCRPSGFFLGLLGFLHPTLLVRAFVYEFQKDPVPLASSYWILGQVSISNLHVTDKERPQIVFNAKTSVDNAAALDTITAKLPNVQIGFAPDYVFTKMDDKNKFCCADSDGCEKGAGTFSLSSAKHAGTSTIYSASLKEPAPITFNPVGGNYFLWIANCGDSPLAGLKVSGEVKVRQSYGFVRPEELICKNIAFYWGLLALAFAALYGCQVCFLSSSVKEGKGVKYCLLTAVALSALRLLGGSSLYYSSWNATGIEGSGGTPYSILAALQICASMTLYEFLASQHHLTAYNSITESSAKGDAIMVAGGRATTTLQEWLLLTIANVGLFVSMMFMFLGIMKVENRPPASFFVAATDPAQIAGGGTADGTLFLGLEKTDWVVLAILLIVIYPVMVFVERKEGVIVNDFTTKIFWPVRRLLLTLFSCVVLLQMILQYVAATLVTEASGGIVAAELEASVRCASLELAVLCSYFCIAHYLSAWDSMTQGSNYSIVSEKDLEMAQVDNADEDIDAEVENYDPDELAEKRQLE
ncbi:unnamed protein product [Amoebophrya sp. A120]|nr:unnamed protein product [Amoebophrya sp. A120]|eukprot:GSA120T00023322001.1